MSDIVEATVKVKMPPKKVTFNEGTEKEDTFTQVYMIVVLPDGSEEKLYIRCGEHKAWVNLGTVERQNASLKKCKKLTVIDNQIYVPCGSNDAWIKAARRGKTVTLYKEWSPTKKNAEGNKGAIAYRIITLSDSDPSCTAAYPDAGQILSLFRWMARAPRGLNSPMRQLLTDEFQNGSISKEEMNAYGALFVRAGEIFKDLSGGKADPILITPNTHQD